MKSRTMDYGIDAPGVRRAMFIVALVGMGLGGASMLAPGFGPWSVAILGLGVAVAAYGLGMGCYMTWASRRGKLQTRQQMLDHIHGLRPWRGDEAVIDVGCGRGLMMIGAARRLTTGLATGLDLWRSEDQAGNSPEAAMTNARLEGVEHRIAIKTGDARDMPFSDASADIVLSHWVVHNIQTKRDRDRALEEMWRVLCPGGVIALADIEYVSDYAETMSAFDGARAIVDEGGWRSWIMGVLSGGSFRPKRLYVLKTASGSADRGRV